MAKVDYAITVDLIAKDSLRYGAPGIYAFVRPLNQEELTDFKKRNDDREPQRYRAVSRTLLDQLHGWIESHPELESRLTDDQQWHIIGENPTLRYLLHVGDAFNCVRDGDTSLVAFNKERGTGTVLTVEARADSIFNKVPPAKVAIA